MYIHPDWVVLEIGSGNNPNPRSNILCDRFIHDNGQRAGKFSIVIDRPLVVADGYHLPFATKSFDYIICSHILEHMSDPQAFIQEVARVGKAGYIEVPSIYAERLFGWKFHLWYCKKTSKGIVLYPKTDGEKYGGFFHRLIVSNIWFRRFFEEHDDYFNIKYEWHDIPNIIRSRKKLSLEKLQQIDSENYSLLIRAQHNFFIDSIFYAKWIVRRIYRKMNKELKRIHWEIQKYVNSDSIIKKLIPWMECPHCHGQKMARENNNILCYQCQASFEVHGVLPVMLLRTAKKRGY